MFGSSLRPVVCRMAHYVICYLCFFVHSGVQHILCCVFCFVCLRLVYPILSVSLDCTFVISPSVFSNGYLLFVDLFAS
jgi:hypothetical protein